MLIKYVTAAGLAILASLPRAHGQSVADPASAPLDAAALCHTYADFKVIFVGRTESPVTYHVSGEPRIEEARRELQRIKDDVARVRASLAPGVPDVELETELEIRIIRAESELNDRRARYPEPYDLTFIPVRVEQPFRGVTEPTLMMMYRGSPSVSIEPGEQYLISGFRVTGERHTLPDIPDPYDFNEYVQAVEVTPIAAAQESVRFLASIASGATIFGSLRMHSFGDGAGPALRGIRVVVSSGAHSTEAVTQDDGDFTISGLEPGHLEITPLLREDLTVVERSSLTMDVVKGECRTASFAVALNGRVRGRIVSATNNLLAGVELVLQSVDSNGRLGGSHSPTTTIRPNENGTYEFFGQNPGAYVLSARLMRMEDGHPHYLVTYYPGVPDVVDARPIVIGRATQLDGFDFLVKTE